jgi:hypothetical protein
MMGEFQEAQLDGGLDDGIRRVVKVEELEEQRELGGLLVKEDVEVLRTV